MRWLLNAIKQGEPNGPPTRPVQIGVERGESWELEEVQEEEDGPWPFGQRGLWPEDRVEAGSLVRWTGVVPMQGVQMVPERDMCACVHK